MSLLAVEGVSMRFGGLAALSEVSFTVAEREIVGLMGANGAGKTTLFALIAGNLRPSAGAIRFAGRRIDGLRPEAVCRAGIGRTFQIVRPFLNLSLRQNVAVAVMYGARRERSVRRAEAAAEAILGEFGLGDRAGDPAAALTLAGRKRLEIARTVATGARLLLLDEVMAGLTAAEVSQTLDLIRALRDRHGLTLLVIEHVMKALMRLSDRIVVLHHGQLVTSGAPAAVAADPAVIEAYFGRQRA